ncbi:hypothetical protein HOY82DRAFT_607068 [Tuber indicum]|nr:hypothetical protein HOY82DRAFT_607068 [Tuber indicum]
MQLLSVSRFGLDGRQMLYDYYATPPTPNKTRPYVTLDELYGGNSPLSVEPKVAVPFNLTFLREVADHWICEGGHLPA